MLATDLPHRYSGPFAEATPAGTPYQRLYVNETGDENVLVTVPDSALERDDVTVVIACHGWVAEHETWNQHPPFVAVRDMCNDEGWIFAAPHMHGDQWGNQVAMDDVARVAAYFRALWPTVRILLVGASMGGLAVLNAVSRRAVADVAGVVAVGSVIDLGVAHSISSYRPSIQAAYGVAADGSDFTEKTTGYNPIARPGVAWADTNIDLYHSPGDSAITLASHPLAWEATGRPAWARWHRLTVTTGEHLDAGNFDLPRMREFMRAAASGMLAPAASSSGVVTMSVWDGFDWVEVPTMVQAADGTWVEAVLRAYA